MRRLSEEKSRERGALTAGDGGVKGTLLSSQLSSFPASRQPPTRPVRVVLSARRVIVDPVERARRLAIVFDVMLSFDAEREATERVEQAQADAQSNPEAQADEPHADAQAQNVEPPICVEEE